MGQRIAGICYVKADGEQFEVSGGLEAPLFSTKKESVMGLNAVVGYKETAIAPYVKLSAVVGSKFNLDKLRSASAMTVTAEFANGKVYTLSDAWVAGEPALKGDDGTTELEFNGLKGIWQ